MFGTAASGGASSMEPTGVVHVNLMFYVSALVVLTSLGALYVKYAASKSKEYDLYAPRQNGTQEQQAEGPKVSVLFGTQTGTAERFANQISEEINERYPKVKAAAYDIETYDHENKLEAEELALFCVATYGDGEPTDSALNFTTWMGDLVSKGEEDGSMPLKGLKYGVFALGNKQYEHYCACGKLVDRRLKALGATQVIERGEGDDDANIEDDFAAWKEKLWVELDNLGYAAATKMNGANGHHANGNGVAVKKTPSKAPEEFSVEKVAGTASLWRFDKAEIGPNSPVEVPVSERRELHTSESDRSCIHAELDISGTNLSYETGDHVGIFASNPPELVSEALKRLDYDGKSFVKLTAKPGSKLSKLMFEGKAMSIRDLVSYFLDLQSPPRKESLLALAACASDPKEKARLEHLASKEGRDEYRSYILDDLRSLLEVLQAFPSAKPSLGVFAARIAPKLQPRFYSISSSPLKHPKSIHISCALVEGDSPTGRYHKRVASTWLSRCKPNSSKIAVFVRKSNFKLPQKAEAPIIMIGPGTGFAPFRGFLQEREAQASMGGAGLGEAHLYFGCRSRTKDFIYEDEIMGWKESDVLSMLNCAFSRDQAKKVYVQDLIKQRAQEFYRLIGEEKASLYICGDKNMAKDVNLVLHSIIQQQGGKTSSEAEGMIKDMQTEGRYMRDVW
ncbi:NADPH--cytochrome P450 reductase [Chloropicon primus]|nr:NADPH--cytochrome P450 reductase [Chloropicon primus]